MTPELIAIVMVGIALAGVILASTRGIRQDMGRSAAGYDAVGVAAGWEDRCAERPAW